MGYMSAMDGVRMGIAGLQNGLHALNSPRVPLSAYYKWQTTEASVVSVEAYNEVVVAHNALVQALAAEKRESAGLKSQLRETLKLLQKAVQPPDNGN